MTTFKFNCKQNSPLVYVKPNQDLQKSKPWVIVPPRAVLSLSETISNIFTILIAAPPSDHLPLPHPPPFWMFIFLLLGFWLFSCSDYG